MSPSKCAALYILIFIGLSLSACSRTRTVCLPVDKTSQPALQLPVLIGQPSPVPGLPGLVEVEIQGRLVKVDKVVDYPLCNDNWSGVVYVSCDARVAEGELDENANPLFLKGCDLEIAPNTVVYVAAHNDAAYYKGCSCHTGETPLP